LKYIAIPCGGKKKRPNIKNLHQQEKKGVTGTKDVGI